MNVCQMLKRQYQKLLEYRSRKRLEKPDYIPVSSDMVFQARPEKPFRFGVIGTGHVFDRWMHDMRMLPAEAQICVHAVTARDPERIRGKAESFGVRTIYDSYESMLADPLIDAIYVATPNHLHASHAVQALRAGKHVLCEKPVCVTTAELDLILAVAQEEHLLFLEGMWMRTLPMIRRLQAVVSSGTIGKLRLIQTRCCNSNSPERYPALYDPAQAGGAMMDVGCYALHFAQLFHPLDNVRLSFAADLAPTGVDRSSSVTIASEDILVTLCQSIGAAGGAYAILSGTEGSIEVPLFLSPDQFTVISPCGKRTIYHYPVPRSRRPIGYAYEILHFADLVRSGSTTQNLIPHSDTGSVLNIMAQFRRSCGMHIGSELQRNDR